MLKKLGKICTKLYSESCYTYLMWLITMILIIIVQKWESKAVFELLMEKT